MDNVEYIGFIAGVFTIIALLLQIFKILKTKSTKDLSLLMYIIYCVGLTLWIYYGHLVNSYSLIVINIITLIFALIIIIIKLRG